jgi:hypothetical protein
MTNRDIHKPPLKSADTINCDLTAALAAEGDTPPQLLDAADRLQKALDQKRREIVNDEEADLETPNSKVADTTKPPR